MSDITKCTNSDCPLKESCYRWTAEAEEHQSYAKWEPKDGECEEYWDNLK
jgi:hypothetical protein